MDKAKYNELRAHYLKMLKRAGVVAPAGKFRKVPDGPSADYNHSEQIEQMRMLYTDASNQNEYNGR